jgi:hypothetical protein
VWFGHFRHAHRGEEFSIPVAETKRRASDLAIASGTFCDVSTRGGIRALFRRASILHGRQNSVETRHHRHRLLGDGHTLPQDRLELSPIIVPPAGQLLG